MEQDIALAARCIRADGPSVPLHPPLAGIRDANPDDMEEAIWAFLCDAQTDGLGFDVARKRLLRGGK